MNEKPKALFVNVAQFGHNDSLRYYSKYISEVYDIDYICFDKNLVKYQDSRIKVQYQKFFGINKYLRILNFTWATVRKSKQENYNLLVCEYYKTAILVGIFSKAQFKIIDIQTGSVSNNRIKRIIENSLLRISAIPYDRASILSENLLNLIRLKRKKSFIVPIGAEPISEKEKQYNSLKLIYIGTLNNRKIEETVEGIYLFQSKNKIPIEYNIIGTGSAEARNKIIKTIKKLHLENQIHLLGYKRKEEIIDIVEQSTIGIAYIPITTYYDVQPSTKIFEYALSGLITIATDTIENRKVITDSNGVICRDSPQSFADAIETTVMKLNAYRENEIRASLKNYHWAEIVKTALIPNLPK